MGILSSSTNTVPQKYIDNRDNIQNGDLILYRGNSMMAKAIQYLDRAFYNHIGVVWKVEDPESKEYRILTLDMWSKGLVVVPLSERMSGYDDFCILRPNVTQDKIETAIFDGLRLWEGKLGYDYSLIFRVALIKKLGIDVTSLGKTDRYICYEFAQAYCKNFINTYNNINLITPEDLRRYIDSNFELILDDAGLPNNTLLGKKIRTIGSADYNI